MKIALIGYGRMGQEIEKIALERGHSISVKMGKDSFSQFDSQAFKTSDVAIEFSLPETALGNYKQCFKNNIPVVSGTTGWLDSYDELIQQCEQEHQTFFYASNFSVGVNIFFEINKKLAFLMNQAQGYDVELEEIHHTKKLDAPSGTAISLAEQIVTEYASKEKWALDSDNNKELNITAKRVADTPGTHTIKYNSEIDDITIEHKAKSRKGFALGAVLAAEFVKNKKGVYSMKDLLDF